jgi:hypothetical protein
MQSMGLVKHPPSSIFLSHWYAKGMHFSKDKTMCKVVSKENIYQDL